MKRKAKLDAVSKELDREAMNTTDIRPLSAEMRRQWDAAKKTGLSQKTNRRGRPPKEPALKSRIVPISIEPSLLEEVDRYAKVAGFSRSRLIAEALRLRMQR